MYRSGDAKTSVLEKDVPAYDSDEYVNWMQKNEVAITSDSRESFLDDQNRVKGVVVYLPHSCNEWVIGGKESVAAMIADLQSLLLKL